MWHNFRKFRLSQTNGKTQLNCVRSCLLPTLHRRISSWKILPRWMTTTISISNLIYAKEALSRSYSTKAVRFCLISSPASFIIIRANAKGRNYISRLSGSDCPGSRQADQWERNVRDALGRLSRQAGESYVQTTANRPDSGFCNETPSN